MSRKRIEMVRDDKYPNMYRSVMPNSGLSDMANLTRTKAAIRGWRSSARNIGRKRK